MLGRRRELRGDGGGVEPDVLAADETVGEFEDVQHPEVDLVAVAGHAEHGADDGGSPCPSP